jgi:peptide/nickel transport system substrate-binding protein
VITRPKASLQIAVIAVALALALTACGGSSKPKATGTTTGGGKIGGNIVLGAEQWPSCVNPINQCANSSWLQWLVPIHVLPRLAELDDKNVFVASPLLKELPSIDNGGVTGSGKTFTVTYHLNPDAKWDDGTPITSADVKFTWRAYLDSTGSLSTTGYDQISSIDTPDPQTAAVHFKVTYNDWPDVMGGFSGVVLQKSKFKSTNVGKDMNTTIGFSGGPWKLESFTKDKEVLVRNPTYWAKDRVAKLDSVTFVPLTETTKEVQAIKTGSVAAIYPQPASENVPQLTNQSGITTKFGVNGQYENIWFNEKPGHPFADKNVRGAMAYAIDRQLLLNDIVKPFYPTADLLQCAMWIPQVGPWCETPGPFTDLTASPDKVTSMMQTAGYAKDSSGMWAKGGQPLTIKWMADTGNKRREGTQAEFIPLLKKQGFNVVPDNSEHDTVFQKRLPAGEYDMAMFINVASPDPTVTSSVTCDQIPGPSNQGQGQNDWWYCNPAADKLAKASDTELDKNKRADDIHQLDKVLRDDFLNVPLYAAPTMLTYRPDQVAGPVEQFINSPESNYWNLWAWSKP